MNAVEHEEIRRRLVAIVFADVVGFSRKMGEDELRTTIAVKDRLRLFPQHVVNFGGHVREFAGDSVFLLFDSSVDAVTFAVEMQKILDQENEDLAEDDQIHFRFGINAGEILVRGEEIGGEAINIAARIEAFAGPGRICISGEVYDHVSKRLKYGYEYLGAQSFKNIDHEVDVFQVHENPTSAAMTPGLRRGLSDASTAKSEPVSDQSIVVLPFGFQGSDESERWFADGLTEDVTTSLSRFQEFFVIARGSANVYSDGTTPPTKAARELGVRYAVDATVRKAGSRLRITLQLIDALNDRTIWGEQYNRSIEDLFELQDEITQVIVSATAAQIEASERERLRMVPPSNLRAYGFVLQGQRHMMRYTKDDVQLARIQFNKALESDPRYARAFAAKSRTFNLDWRYDWAESPETALDDALTLAQTAISLDEQDARGYGENGFAHLYRKEFDAALNAYERAIKLNPNDADLISDYADALGHCGRSEEAIDLLEKAMKLNPFYPDQYIWHLGGAFFNLKRYDEAVQMLHTMQNPTEGRRLLAACYGHLGRLEEAQAEAARVRAAHPNFSVDRWAEVQPDKFQDDVEHFIEGLKKAGL
jgi:TolB-like protein/Tfp pilus assembly protein PilF